MASFIVGYVPGSGFVPLISGNPWSGLGPEPIGGILIRADKNNSGSIYVSLSGGFQYSGQISTLVGSGGPTVQSGTANTTALMDGMPMNASDAYFVPKLAVPITGSRSGVYNICIGCDAAASGQARVYWEVY